MSCRFFSPLKEHFQDFLDLIKLRGELLDPFVKISLEGAQRCDLLLKARNSDGGYDTDDRGRRLGQ